MLLGCVAHTSQNAKPPSVITSVADFAITGKTTCADVESRLGIPHSHGHYSDSRFSFVYMYANGIKINSNINSQISLPKASNVEIIVFIFSQDGILQEWKKDKGLKIINRSKYEAMLDASNTVAMQQGTLTAQQFDEILPGTLSGRLFGEFGKPYHAQDFYDIEKWIYNDVDDSTIHYYLYLQNSRVLKKYSVTLVPYNSQKHPSSHSL